MNIGNGIFLLSYIFTNVFGNSLSSAVAFDFSKLNFTQASLDCASGTANFPSGVCSLVNLIQQKLDEANAQKKALEEQQKQLDEQRRQQLEQQRQMEEQARQQQQNQQQPQSGGGQPPGGGGQQGGGQQGGGQQGGNNTPPSGKGPVADPTRTPEPTAPKAATEEESAQLEPAQEMGCVCESGSAATGLGEKCVDRKISVSKGASKTKGMEGKELMYIGEPKEFAEVSKGGEVTKPKAEFTKGTYKDGQVLGAKCTPIPGHPGKFRVANGLDVRNAYTPTSLIKGPK